MKSVLSMAALVGAMLSTTAFAALTLERSTTLADSFGGTVSIVTSGSIEIPGADTSSQATLANFHPHDKQNLSVSGSLARAHERSNETVTNTYNGSVTVTGTDKDGKAVDDTLVLQNVQVVREGNGPAFSGTIVFNGNTIDAAQMPDALKRLVRGVLRLLDFD